jgi:hypothetical protein
MRLIGMSEDLDVDGRMLHEDREMYCCECDIAEGDVSRFDLHHSYFKGVKCDNCIQGNNGIGSH